VQKELKPATGNDRGDWRPGEYLSSRETLGYGTGGLSARLKRSKVFLCYRRNLKFIFLYEIKDFSVALFPHIPPYVKKNTHSFMLRLRLDLAAAAQQESQSAVLKLGDAWVGVPARPHHCHMRQSTSLVKGHSVKRCQASSSQTLHKEHI
jgi:hypothetical protein